ncbi:hypothetical protein BS47DRAFT_1442774, partial [Hydnum rufescens UP504]
QVEYAMEAILHAGARIGVLEKDGVILAVEKKVAGELLDLSIAKEGGHSSTGVGQALFPRISSDVVARVAGLTADANSLVYYAQQAAQRHLFSFNEDIPVEQLAQRLCDLKQDYTQYGGLHPFGLSPLYAGYDSHYQLQLHPSDLSGNYSGWTAMCICANNDTAQCLKQECKDDLSMEEAITLMINIMSKTMDSTTLSSGKLEFLILTLGPMMKQLLVKIYKPVETGALLAKHGIEKMAS